MTAIARLAAGTRLAQAGRVHTLGLLHPPALRLLAALAALAAWIAPASASPADESLWQLEVRAGYGLALGGSGEAMSRRLTPLTLSADIAVAVMDEPRLAGYGGLVVETLDRNAAGAVFGVELHPHHSRLHLAGGGTWLVAPYTLYGPTATAGACFHASPGIGVCTDLQITAFIGGSDLPDGTTVTQAQLALGLVFDAL